MLYRLSPQQSVVLSAESHVADGVELVPFEAAQVVFAQAPIAEWVPHS